MESMTRVLNSLVDAKMAATGLGFDAAVKAVLEERPHVLTGVAPVRHVPQRGVSGAAMTRQQAGDLICELAEPLQASEGLTFSDAVTRVCRENPDLEQAYSGHPRAEAAAQPVPGMSRAAASAEIDRLAQAIMHAEGGDYTAAVIRVCKEHPNLAATYAQR